jgi:hypothetical protein
MFANFIPQSLAQLHWGLICTCLIFISGCATMNQKTDEVLVRDPQAGVYSAPVKASIHAKDQWVYAAMSEWVYEQANLRKLQDMNQPAPKQTTEKIAVCDGAQAPEIPPEWAKWTNFPSADAEKTMRDLGLYLEVYERTVSPREIVVVFEGTDFSSLKDWFSNLRWFLRFIPSHEDQYTMTANRISKEFFDHLRAPQNGYQVSETSAQLRSNNGEPINIIAAGHSLGGGLAQHFAYTFKQATPQSRGPKVSRVYAFDTSPVTGWFSSERPQRDYNAEGLQIQRIFEHGEILAYVRLLTSRLAISRENPSIWEYRYNFDEDWHLVGNHSMRKLACGLAQAAQNSPK